MALDWPAAWRTWRTYRGTGAVTQAFLVARMAVAPLGPLSGDFKALRGRVLSLGCGHGVVDRYLADVNPNVTIDGYDLDGERISIARATQSRSPRFTPHIADVTTLVVDNAYDAALCIDIFHHIAYEQHEHVLQALADRVRTGGVCLVKEMASSPRRQYLWNRFHDRIVAGPEPIYCREPDEFAGVMADAGFAIEKVERVRRLGIYPQYVVVGRKR